MSNKAILCFSDNGILLIKTQAGSTSHHLYKIKDTQKLSKLINLDKARTCIVLLPGYSKQCIKTEGIPYASYFNIKQLTERIMECDFFPCNLKKSFLVSHGYNQLFYSSIFAKLSNEILELISEIKWYFNGVYLYSLESIGIFSALSPTHNKKTILLYTNPNNISIIKINKHNVVECSQNTAIEYTTPKSIAGYFIQNLEDICSDTKHHGEIYTIIPTQIKNAILEYDAIPRNDVIFLTPYEASILLKIESLLDVSENFADILFASNIILKKSKYRCIPQCYKKHFQLTQCNSILNYLFAVAAPILLMVMLLYKEDLDVKKNNHFSLEKELHNISNNFKSLQGKMNAMEKGYKGKRNLYRALENNDNSTINHLRNINDVLDFKRLKLARQKTHYEINVTGISKIDSETLKKKIAEEYSYYKITPKKGDITHINIKWE